MSGTYTTSQTNTFTKSHAEYLASKVKTDLMRLHRYYGRPSLKDIENFEKELVLLQIYDLLYRAEYGFILGETWIKALCYTAGQGGTLTADDDPGGVDCTDISKDAIFTSFLRYNSNWNLDSAHTQNFLQQRPFSRTAGNGYSGNWSEHRTYSAGGRDLVRSGI